MKASFLIHTLSILLGVSIALSSGCRLQIISPKGGKVVSSSGTYVCKSDHTCTIEISDVTFDEEFIAQPKQDHVFVMWSHGSLCAFRRIPCKINSAWAQVHPLFMDILLSDNTYPQKTIFTIPGSLTISTIPEHVIVRAGETATAEIYFWTSWTSRYVTTSAWRTCHETMTCYVEASPKNKPSADRNFVYKDEANIRDITIRTSIDTPKGMHYIAIDFNYDESDFDTEVQNYGSGFRLTVI